MGSYEASRGRACTIFAQVMHACTHKKKCQSFRHRHRRRHRRHRHRHRLRHRHRRRRQLHRRRRHRRRLHSVVSIVIFAVIAIVIVIVIVIVLTELRNAADWHEKCEAMFNDAIPECFFKPLARGNTV